VETHTLPSSRDRSALTAALKPLAVDGTTISFISLKLGRQTARAGRPQPGPGRHYVACTWNKNEGLIRTLPCG